jgi:hypothetical protein
MTTPSWFSNAGFNYLIIDGLFFHLTGVKDQLTLSKKISEIKAATNRAQIGSNLEPIIPD